MEKLEAKIRMGLTAALCLAAAGGSEAQDSSRMTPPAAPVNPPVAVPAGQPETPAAPLQARPVLPAPTNPSSEFAPQFTPPGGGMTLPPQAVDRAPAATPVQPSEPGPAVGPTISSMQSRARVVEAERPERVQVYPQDPDSAWWEINPHFAFDRAQREQKPMMLLFTGMWNTQAMALSQEVFATKSFNEYVKENLVICYLSYPRNYSDAHPKLRAIKDKFKVRGYPNVLIFNPNGEVQKGITGYRSGRPVDYFNELKLACSPVLESVRAQKAELVRRGYRDWSNYLGKMIFARFVKHDKVRVVLQDVSGQDWIIPLNDLAPDDQKLVESFPAVATVEPAGE